MPNLTIAAFEAPASSVPGEWIHFRVLVRNAGAAPSTAFWLIVDFPEAGDEPTAGGLGMRITGMQMPFSFGLEAGAEMWIAGAARAPAGGSLAITATADRWETVSESDEADNVEVVIVPIAVGG